MGGSWRSVQTVVTVRVDGDVSDPYLSSPSLLPSPASPPPTTTYPHHHHLLHHITFCLLKWQAACLPCTHGIISSLSINNKKTCLPACLPCLQCLPVIASHALPRPSFISRAFPTFPREQGQRHASPPLPLLLPPWAWSGRGNLLPSLLPSPTRPHLFCFQEALLH